MNTNIENFKDIFEKSIPPFIPAELSLTYKQNGVGEKLKDL